MKITLFIVLVLLLGGCEIKGFDAPVDNGNVDSQYELENGEETEETALLIIRTSSGDKQFNVEIADTFSKKRIGLMNRSSLPKDNGMFFVFEAEVEQNFWMKNTLIPLDMIFIDRNYNIVNIVKMAQPCKEDPCGTYSSEMPAKYVLEINGGLSDELNLKAGDKIILEYQTDAI
jgi:uncharacterized protein